MANVSHASLTGAQLHEPKGAAAAAQGEVYVANGSGSGNWTSISVSAFTGMIADFVAPAPPTGWLELNGAIISTSTYAALASVMKIAFTGTRNSGSAIISGIASTANMRAGYYVFGTGFVAGTIIVTVDSPTQITVSNTASSSGTGALDCSPWAMNTGTITLPDLTTSGRYRRSRTASTKVGDIQASQNLAHTHGVSGTTSGHSVDHTHTFSGTSGGQSVSHTHTYNDEVNRSGTSGGGGAFFQMPNGGATAVQTGAASADHTHAYSGTTGGVSANHTHTFSATSASDGGTDVRPLTLVVLTCVKT